MVIDDYFKILGNYEFKNGVYNVKGSVKLIKYCEKLPVKFGKVSGSFSCSCNKLKTLEGSPKSVVGFFCNDNKLTSLEGSPTQVGSHFYCFGNKLTSLEGCPTRIGGNFSCDDNLHNNLEYRQYLIMKKLRK